MHFAHVSSIESEKSNGGNKTMRLSRKLTMSQIRDCRMCVSMAGTRIVTSLFVLCIVCFFAVASVANAENILADANDRENTENGSTINVGATPIRVGVGSEPFGNGRNVVINFQARRVGPSQLADNKFEYCGYEPNLGLRMAILISKPHG